METNPIENIVNQINRNVFFMEFTFSNDDSKVDNAQLELADYLVWLDDIEDHLHLHTL